MRNGDASRKALLRPRGTLIACRSSMAAYASASRSAGRTRRRTGCSRPAAAIGSTFPILVLAVMLAAAVVAVSTVLGLAALAVVPAIVTTLG